MPLAAGTGGLALGTRAAVIAGMRFTVGWMRHSERQLASWITGNTPSAAAFPEMQSTMIAGGARMASMILFLLTTMIIIRSMVRVQREAVGSLASGPAAAQCQRDIGQLLPAQPCPAGAAAAAVDRQPGAQ